jgi:hypothetical protein
MKTCTIIHNGATMIAACLNLGRAQVRCLTVISLMLLSAGVLLADDQQKPITNSNSGWVGVVGTAVGALLGAVISPVSIYLYRRWNRPVLATSIEVDGGSLLETPVFDGEDRVAWEKRLKTDPGAKPTFSGKALYARLKVRNKGRRDDAVQCRGTLIRLEKTDSGDRKPLPFTDPIQLSWAGGDLPMIDLPKEIPGYLNLCHLNLKANEMKLCASALPFMYWSLMDDDGIYFFHVLLTAKNADPVTTVVIRVTWNKAQAIVTVEMEKSR